MEKQKVLVVTLRPPVIREDKQDLRLINILKELKEQGFEITLFYQMETEESIEGVNDFITLRESLGMETSRNFTALLARNEYKVVLFSSVYAAQMHLNRVKSLNKAKLFIVPDRPEEDLSQEFWQQFDGVIRKPQDIMKWKEGGAARKDQVSIIMLTFNQLKTTKECLESLREKTNPSYELIIVDNGSTDGTVKYLKSLKDVECIFNTKNLAFSKANNQGIKRAKYEYLLLLNNDVILAGGWLEGLLACMKSEPGVGLVGPCSNTASGAQLVKPGYKRIRDLEKFAAYFKLKNAGRWVGVHRLNAFCFLLKREVIERIGLLDERFGPGGFEDYDYCLRVRQAGYKIMLAGDVYIHHIGGQGYEPNRLDYHSLREVNRHIFIEKWCRKALEIMEIIPQGDED